MGWLGVLCLAVLWTVRLAPESGDIIFGVSSVRKFIALGAFLAVHQTSSMGESAQAKDKPMPKTCAECPRP